MVKSAFLAGVLSSGCSGSEQRGSQEARNPCEDCGGQGGDATLPPPGTGGSRLAGGGGGSHTGPGGSDAGAGPSRDPDDMGPGGSDSGSGGDPSGEPDDWVADLDCQDSERPDPARWESDMASFALRDLNSPPPDEVLVFVGSSSITRWDTLEQDFSPRPVVKNGFGGAWVSDLIAHFGVTIAPYNASAFVLYIGENDIVGGLSPACAFLDLLELISILRDRAVQVPLFLVSVKPSPARVSLLDAMQELNGYVDRYAATSTDVHFVDVHAPMLDQEGVPLPELFDPDDVHMSAEGYELWAEILVPAVETQLE